MEWGNHINLPNGILVHSKGGVVIVVLQCCFSLHQSMEVSVVAISMESHSSLVKNSYID